MGLDPPYLADRTSQLRRFDQYLAGFPDFPRNIRLTGLRGVGKTVLLQHYADLAEERGWVVVRRECSEQSKSAGPGATVRRPGVAQQSCRIDKSRGDRHVDGDERLDCRQTNAKID